MTSDEKHELTKKAIRSQVQDALDALKRANTIMSNLEKEMTKRADCPEGLYELFDDIRSNQMHDIYEIMREFEDIGALEDIPDGEDDSEEVQKKVEEGVKKFMKVVRAEELIKEAISVGVLEAAGPGRVYILTSDDGKEENSYWMPLSLHDAAQGLVQNNAYEVVMAAVEEKKAEMKKN